MSNELSESSVFNGNGPNRSLAELEGLVEQARALRLGKRNNEAVELLRPWVTDAHLCPGLLFQLGMALRGMSCFEDAVDTLNLFLKLDPENEAGWFSLGYAYEGWGRSEEATGAYLQAIVLNPSYGEAYNNLGSMLFNNGRIKEASTAYRQCMTLKPSILPAFSSFAGTMDYRVDLSRESIYEAHLEAGRRISEAAVRLESNTKPLGGRDVIRLGFVSRDFYRHSVMHFFKSVYENVDDERFEIFIYSDGEVSDAYSADLKSKVRFWRDIQGMPSSEAAELIRYDGVDILFDLAGHTANNRLELFAMRPAPQQVTWLGYPNTTGLPEMDYRLTDAEVDPPEEQGAFCSEQVLRLPEGFHCFSPSVETPEVNGLPCGNGQGITFGCFNSQMKINPQVVGVWAKILERVPGSRIVLKSNWFSDEAVRLSYARMFEEAGVDLDRVEVRSWTRNPVDGIRQYGEVDVALDTFPYNGTTTTCEALWMGVPVVTLRGETCASRVGSSLLKQLGRPEWICGNGDDYVDRVCELVSDLDSLASVRKGLREEMRGSVLCDQRRFAGHFFDLMSEVSGKHQTEDGEPDGKSGLNGRGNRAVMRKTGRGALYVVWGDVDEKLLERARTSLRRHHPELPSEVLRLPSGCTLLDKARMFEMSPFRETVFLDADTVVLDRLDFGFDMAVRHGLACSICENPWARRYGSIGGDIVEYNTGVLFFTEKAKGVFDVWEDLATRLDSSLQFYAGDELNEMPYNDQAAFAKALEQGGSHPFVLPMNWNFRPLWHRTFFGPIKIWHDYREVPAAVLDWNRDQTDESSVTRFGNLGEGVGSVDS